jgi:hypothetical protein
MRADMSAAIFGLLPVPPISSEVVFRKVKDLSCGNGSERNSLQSKGSATGLTRFEARCVMIGFGTHPISRLCRVAARVSAARAT